RVVRLVRRYEKRNLFVRRCKEFAFFSRLLYIFKKFDAIILDFCNTKPAGIGAYNIRVWFEAYAKLFNKFFFFIVFNAPVIFIKGELIEKFFSFFKRLNKAFRKISKPFPYKLQKLVYNLSNYLVFSYRRHVRFNAWRKVF